MAHKRHTIEELEEEFGTTWEELFDDCLSCTESQIFSHLEHGAHHAPMNQGDSNRALAKSLWRHTTREAEKLN